MHLIFLHVWLNPQENLNGNDRYRNETVKALSWSESYKFLLAESKYDFFLVRNEKNIFFSSSFFWNNSLTS